MRTQNKIAFFLGCIFITYTAFGSHNCCVAQLTAHNVQEILDAINIIRPTIISIRIEIEELLSCCDDLRSVVDNINTVFSTTDQLQSCCDTVNSKIGDLDGPGTCLDSQIDVPDDINNLNLTVIQLLKTILLELRGCPCQ